jgi:type III pantothenate kinase
MLLACDIGNSTITLGLFEQEKLTAHWRLSSELSKREDEYRVGLQELLHVQGLAGEQITGSILCSVVPALTLRLHRVLEAATHQPPIIVSHTLDLGLVLDHYPHPDEIGADRLVNASAAYALYERSVIIVDMGTATTFDVVGRTGEFLGGAIAPGLVISADALTTRTAKLPRVELQRPKSAIGQDTVASMQSGLVFGYAGLVDGLIRRIQDELPSPAMVVATGGLSSLVAPACHSIQHLHPHLTLEGLARIYRRYHP